MRITPWKHSRRFLQRRRNTWEVDCYSWDWPHWGLYDMLHPFARPVWANAGMGTVRRASRQPLLTLLDQP